MDKKGLCSTGFPNHINLKNNHSVALTLRTECPGEL